MFEEAIAIASLLLDDGRFVATTVRTSQGFVDNSFQVAPPPLPHLEEEPWKRSPASWRLKGRRRSLRAQGGGLGVPAQCSAPVPSCSAAPTAFSAGPRL